MWRAMHYSSRASSFALSRALALSRANTVLLCSEGLEEDDETERLMSRVQEDGLDLLKALALTDKELSLVLCNDAFIHELNAEHRNVDSATDVLSFPLGHEVLLGDVIISVETAGRQAQERNYEMTDELRVLLVHGVLHLIGYDHELGAEEHKSMAAAEQEALSILDWKGVGLCY